MTSRSLVLTAAALGLLAVACGKGGCEAPPFVPEGVDLSAGGAYANCYMVEKDGKYFFEAKRVDGSPVENIASADWIWSTKDAAGNGLVDDVEYKAGYISFTAGDARGNALIGAFDAAGNVLWSWHLWLTEAPALQALDNGAVFMDRNLGAMSASPEDGPLTYGLKYQWGRKDPFYAGSSNEDAGSVFSMAREATVFNPGLDAGWTSVKRDASSGSV